MKPLEAHFNLMQRLPVRTVQSRRQPPEPSLVYSDRAAGQRDHDERVRLILRAQKMAAAGVERAVIAEALNLNSSTVDCYITGRISKAARRRLYGGNHGIQRHER